MTGNRWRVQRTTRPDPALGGPWMVRRAVWDRWHDVARYDHHADAVRAADRMARRR